MAHWLPRAGFTPDRLPVGRQVVRWTEVNWDPHLSALTVSPMGDLPLKEVGVTHDYPPMLALHYPGGPVPVNRPITGGVQDRPSHNRTATRLGRHTLGGPI